MPPGRPPTLIDEQITEIRRLRYEERLSAKEIISRTNYSEYLVYKYAPGKVASRYLTNDEITEIKRLRYEEKKTCREVAGITGHGVKKIRELTPGFYVQGEFRQLSCAKIHRIKTLRYEDGMTMAQVAEIVGCHLTTVRRIAPGKPGKVSNSKLREKFLDSTVPATEVARRVGWFCNRNNGRHDPDISRLKRSLGILSATSTRNGNKKKYVQKMIDIEAALLICDAIGADPCEVGAR